MLKSIFFCDTIHTMKIGKLLIISVLLTMLFSPFSHAQNEMTENIEVTETFLKAEVIRVGERVDGGEENFMTSTLPLEVRLSDGPQAGQELKVDFNVNPDVPDDEVPVSVGDSLVLVHSSINGEGSVYIYEPYRVDMLMILVMIFVFIVVFVAGKQGFYSLVGLLVTLVILLKGVLPLIIAGRDPVAVCFFGSLLIATTSLYLAHGFSKRTTLSLVSTFITLFLAFGLSVLAVSWVHLFGMGSEDALSFTFSNLAHVDLKGLLLGAIVIGTLGILDDVTTTQVAIIDELHKADPCLDFKELYKRGLSVGKEHIASLVNTLLIAYVGASFPVFLLIVNSHRPLWVIVNNEFLAEEIVRTLVGSMTLVVAVPISTLIAAHYYSRFLVRVK